MQKNLFPINKIKQYLKNDFFIEIAATSMLALGIRVFSAPNRIVGGGVSGISSVLYVLFGLPIGVTSFLINLPLLFIGWKKLGKRFILRTLRMVFYVSIMTDCVFSQIPAYHGEKLLAALFGGVLMGAGLGFILMRGDSTGGTDIIVKLIQKKKPYMPLSNIIIMTDATVVLSAAIAYKSIDTILYGLIMIYSSSAVIDRIVSGSDARKLSLIVTREERAVTDALLSQLNRGVTVISASGGYSRSPVAVLMCVVENRQIFQLKQLVYSFDPKAFIIIATAAETLGTGFKQMLDE